MPVEQPRGLRWLADSGVTSPGPGSLLRGCFDCLVLLLGWQAGVTCVSLASSHCLLSLLGLLGACTSSLGFTF